VESVWDYPRPPALEACTRRVRVEVAEVVVAESAAALRVLETTHPPTIYIPAADVRGDLLEASGGRGFQCEFKGRATYLDVVVDGDRRPQAAWSYAAPLAGYEAITDHIAFYAGRVDGAWLDDELVMPQEGDVYGGWITRDLVGPFKGPPETLGW
jgi:uncharacterized protein (DUF427 family)